MSGEGVKDIQLVSCKSKEGRPGGQNGVEDVRGVNLQRFVPVEEAKSCHHGHRTSRAGAVVVEVFPEVGLAAPEICLGMAGDAAGRDSRHWYDEGGLLAAIDVKERPQEDRRPINGHAGAALTDEKEDGFGAPLTNTLGDPEIFGSLPITQLQTGARCRGTFRMFGIAQ